jgi:DHA2 family multidrug resistance protein
LQMMLDRGQSLDWFASREVALEALAASLAFYMFVAHMFTCDEPFLEPGLFKDRNFSVGLIFIFIVGVVLFATMALLPPFMQNLFGYPVLDVGFLLVPRGIGTLIAMITVGRLSGKVDTRLMILIGFALTSLALRQMAHFSLDTGSWDFVRTGVVQGLGVGLTYVPLTTISFATLSARFRNEGTALFNLMRNIGSSIGISAVVTYLAQRTQINHAAFADYITPFNLALRQAAEAGALSIASPQGLAAINGELTRQAATLAYLQDFRLMMFMTLAAIPFILLLQAPARRPERPDETPLAVE